MASLALGHMAFSGALRRYRCAITGMEQARTISQVRSSTSSFEQADVAGSRLPARPKPLTMLESGGLDERALRAS